ncbi:hypothetical protein KKA27_03180 [Patescibacteria group bacterium]|nr:hypothetical protein [Patescibacteria group bacterium]MBU2633551.1 hypothetical protein [Patescibacteria group bacterium]
MKINGEIEKKVRELADAKRGAKKREEQFLDNCKYVGICPKCGMGKFVYKESYAALWSSGGYYLCESCGFKV